MKKMGNSILYVIVVFFLVACNVKGNYKINSQKFIENKQIIEGIDFIQIESSFLVCSLGNKQVRYRLPDIIGYDSISLLKKDRDFLMIKYSSFTHVSHVILFLHFLNDRSLSVENLVDVSPCQTCDPFKIKTNEIVIDFTLDNTDKTDLFEELMDFKNETKEISSRVFVENMDLERLLDYSSKIIKYESVLKIEHIEHILINQPITINNLVYYNNLAYYLQKGMAFKLSTYLLEKILEKFPNRIVAYINLGDAYWGLNEYNKAKEAYKKYVDLMMEGGKESKIPQRVFDRLK